MTAPEPDDCPDRCDCPAWDKSHRIRALESRAAVREAEVQAHMERMEGRVARLEEALREIGYKWEGFQWHSECGSHVEADQRCAACIARAALAPPSGAEKGAPPRADR